jgi:hypothetical protein
MGGDNRIGGIQRPLADRIVFQDDKTKPEDKTFLRELKKCGSDTNPDSPHRVFVVLSAEGANKKHGDVIYQFYFRYQNDVVSKDLSFLMADQSITASKNVEYSIGSTGVRMVKSVPILDTSDKLYQFSHRDRLIVAAALEAGCAMLYTEDLSDGQIINGTLKVINPFIHNDIVNIVISEK